MLFQWSLRRLGTKAKFSLLKLVASPDVTPNVGQTCAARIYLFRLGRNSVKMANIYLLNRPLKKFTPPLNPTGNSCILIPLGQLFQLLLESINLLCKYWGKYWLSLNACSTFNATRSNYCSTVYFDGLKPPTGVFQRENCFVVFWSRDKTEICRVYNIHFFSHLFRIPQKTPYFFSFLQALLLICSY